jgi:hypothetical protein
MVRILFLHVTEHSGIVVVPRIIATKNAAQPFVADIFRGGKSRRQPLRLKGERSAWAAATARPKIKMPGLCRFIPPSGR